MRRIGVVVLGAVATVLVVVWGGPVDTGDHHSGTYDTLAQSAEHSTMGSSTCIRFGGCGYLSHNDHLLTAIDNFGDGRTLIAWGRGCGRAWSVADRDGKGGDPGVRRVPCNLGKHWAERVSRDGLVSKFSGTSGHPG